MAADHDVMLNYTTEQNGGEIIVTFACSVINIAATFPRWEINELVYDVTHLPPGFVATGFRLQLKLEEELHARCFFDVLTITGVVRQYSNFVLVDSEIRGKFHE